MRFVIVTGMSGAGKSTVLKMLEDMGFFCVDNLPVMLIEKFAEIAHDDKLEVDNVAIGVDIRSGQALGEMSVCLETLKKRNFTYEILFLDANEPVLVKRYKETRRAHPLSKHGRINEGIVKEREKIEFLRQRADYIIDTSNLLTRELKHEMFQSIEYKHPKFYQVFRIFIVILASIIFAWNLCCFARPAGLFPGGFSGLSLLLQEIFQKFLHIHVPYTLLNVLLNIIPVYIGFKFIGRKFTLYSILTIILSSIFVDILPTYVFTQDAMLNSVFGGLINGFAISLCLNVGTTTGGTDFISIYLSQRKGIDAWNYILFGNVMLLILAGYLFGWSIALYSIIFQFCSTQAIQILYKRYKKETLFIISDYSEQIYKTIRETTNHHATLFQGIGCYEEKEKTLIYSVINTEAKRQLIPLIRSIDPHAFINIVKTEELAGRFHDIPND